MASPVRAWDGGYPGRQGWARAPGTPSSRSSPPDWGLQLGVPPLSLLSRSLVDSGPGRWAVTRAPHTEVCSLSRAPTSACEMLIPRSQGVSRVGPSGAARENQSRRFPDLVVAISPWLLVWDAFLCPALRPGSPGPPVAHAPSYKTPVTAAGGHCQSKTSAEPDDLCKGTIPQ